MEAEATITAELNAMGGDISGATAKASIVGAEAVIAMKAAATVIWRMLVCCGRRDCAVLWKTRRVFSLTNS